MYPEPSTSIYFFCIIFSPLFLKIQSNICKKFWCITPIFFYLYKSSVHRRGKSYFRSFCVNDFGRFPAWFFLVPCVLPKGGSMGFGTDHCSDRDYLFLVKAIQSDCSVGYEHDGRSHYVGGCGRFCLRFGILGDHPSFVHRGSYFI